MNKFKKHSFCYQIFFWPFTVWINCSTDLKTFENSRSLNLKFQKFFSVTRTIFLTVGQNNFRNKIPFLHQSSQNMTSSSVHFSTEISGIQIPT